MFCLSIVTQVGRCKYLKKDGMLLIHRYSIYASRTVPHVCVTRRPVATTMLVDVCIYIASYGLVHLMPWLVCLFHVKRSTGHACATGSFPAFVNSTHWHCIHRHVAYRHSIWPCFASCFCTSFTVLSISGQYIRPHLHLTN